jgi:hypothetical protein
MAITVYIGDNIRLIYDMLQFTEENDIPGLLLLIDFEKAFYCISWDFLLSVLKFFNFGESIINGVQVFYNNISSAVIQGGNLSEFFQIGRGCRQGVRYPKLKNFNTDKRKSQDIQ